ncbi:MAG TPA: hypothetical protein VF166_09565 [Gemmatimonadaceae bacterium]
MNWPYLHTLINHFPIILSVMGAAAAIAAFAMHRRGIWLYALASLTFAGLSVYPAFLTGDEASDTMRHAWYVVPSMIEEHEEASEIALWVLIATGVISVATWAWQARRDDRVEPPTWLRTLVVIASLASVGTIAYASLLGGRIVHESPKLLTPPPGIAIDTTGRG